MWQYKIQVEIEKTSYQLVLLFRGDELPRRQPGFDYRSRPDLRLEWKRWLFFVTLGQGARSQALQWDVYL
jgi:hypothetical protein